MRIVYIQQHFATGQGEAGVRGYRLVRTLVERGHQVTVLTGRNWRDPTLLAAKGELLTEGYRLRPLGMLYSQHQGFVIRVGSFLLYATHALLEVTRRRADLIFASSTPLSVSLPALWARWLRGTPYVLEVRDLWPDLPIEMGIVRSRWLQRLLLAWERLAYARAWKLVALAPGIAEGIRNKAGVPAERIAMIPNGSDTEGLRPLPGRPRLHLPLGDDRFVLGYAGTHGLANGLDAVLDAAAELLRRGVREPAFVLIGDGREKRRLIDRARTEGLHNVVFLDLVGKDRYGALLAELDVGLQILRNVPGFYWGTSPNKFFDYLAAGRPVLVNYPGWMSELVRQHGCGVTVQPDDPAAFAGAVEHLLGDRARLADMGRRARALAEAQFSQQSILAELARFIEQGLEPPGPRRPRFRPSASSPSRSGTSGKDPA